jgi:hypothetical protein
MLKILSMPKDRDALIVRIMVPLETLINLFSSVVEITHNHG